MVRALIALLAVAIVHVASFAVLWPSFALLHWVGEDSLIALVIRVIASAFLIGFGLVATVAIEDPKSARATMIVAIAFTVIYAGITFGLPDLVKHAYGPIPIIFPRFGRITTAPSMASLFGAALFNPGIVLLFAFGRSAFAANKRREVEDLQRKLGPGASQAEAEAIRKMLEFRPPS